MAALFTFYDANLLYSLHLSKRKARRNPSPHCRYFFNEQLRSSVRHLREPVRTMALVAGRTGIVIMAAQIRESASRRDVIPSVYSPNQEFLWQA
jgi:hypothetical protein